MKPNENKPSAPHWAGTNRTLMDRSVHIRPSRPNAQRIASAVAPIFRQTDPQRIKALDEIARLAGKRPADWSKPAYGDFEFWLGRNCGWISDEELNSDRMEYEARKGRALATSHRFARHRFTWSEQPRHEEPVDNGEYIPEISMKLVRDRNLTDSARRIALMVIKQAYHDNREGRFIGITVSYLMKGLALSRRTVQRSLTLLETRGYFRCEVAKGKTTRMCVGLIIHLMQKLFPGHHRKKWPERRRKPEASSMPRKKIQFYQSIYNAKEKVSRLSWAIRSMNAVARRAFDAGIGPDRRQPQSVSGFQSLASGFLHPNLRAIATP